MGRGSPTWVPVSVRAKVSIDANNASWDSGTLFAWQLIGGVGYQVTPQWTVFGETRWFATQNGNFDGPQSLNFDSKFQSFDLLVGASYNF